jgi:hypothetical protein
MWKSASDSESADSERESEARRGYSNFIHRNREAPFLAYVRFSLTDPIRPLVPLSTRFLKFVYV